MGFFDFFRKTQQVVCVEILFDQIRGALVEFDEKKGGVRFVEYAQYPFDATQGRNEALKILVGVFRKFKRRKNQHIVLGFHDKAALTTRSSASVGRRQADQALHEPELEDLLFKAQWKIFDNVRHAASSRMGISDLDLHLTDAKVEGVRLDGHRVINPVGFRPRRIEFDIINTFASKQFIQDIRTMLGERQQLGLVIERNAALANTVLRTHRRDDGVVLSVEKDVTNILVLKNRNLLYHQQFGWGYASVVNTVARFLSLRLSVAEQVLDKYLMQDMSGVFMRKIEKAIVSDTTIFFDGIVCALDSLKRTIQLPNSIFFNKETPLPPVIAARMRAYTWPSRLWKSPPQVYEIEQNTIADDVRLNMPAPNAFAALLSEFLYGEKGEHYLNEVLHRRVRWLEV